MAKMIIIEGNSNDKDNVRTYMVKGEKGDPGAGGIWGNIEGNIEDQEDLSEVAKTGDYDDLLNKPTIPTCLTSSSESDTNPYSVNYINNLISSIYTLIQSKLDINTISVSATNNGGTIKVRYTNASATYDFIGIEWGTVDVTSGSDASSTSPFNTYSGIEAISFLNTYKKVPFVSTQIIGSYTNWLNTYCYNITTIGCTVGARLLSSNSTRTINYFVIGQLDVDR